MLALAVEGAKAAAEILLRYFGTGVDARVKENRASVVTEADFASERCLIGMFRDACPDHGIIAEEAGFLPGGSDFTWVVDPLDGTSNFAAGLPWFGVIVALMEDRTPKLGVMYLPLSGDLYTAESGRGVFRNGERVRLSPESELANVLCAYGFDCAEQTVLNRQTELLQRIVSQARNVRSTNSLVDFCYTLDGRLGACVSQSTRIWDIAAVSVMFAEAGGRFTGLRGEPVEFRRDASAGTINYQVIAANPSIHAELVRLLA
jgi:myo-inositol-1(or 4)-monophosphatase